MIEISGHSDDVIVMEGHYDDEFEEGAIIDIGTAEATQGQNAQGVRVAMIYAPKWAGAVWVAQIAPLDEDVTIPWPITVTPAANGYSTRVVVDCPEGTPVCVKRKGAVIWRDGTRNTDD